MLVFSWSMDLWKKTFIFSLCLFDKLSISPSSISSFIHISPYHLQFLKFSRSCVILLSTPFTYIISPSISSWRRQFFLRLYPIKLTFICKILLCPFHSYMFKNFFISYFLWPFYFLISLPASHFKTRQVILLQFP